MFQKRIVVCLDVKDGRCTKGIKFKNNIDVGDPVELAAKYYDDGADELVFYDITASHENRGIMIDVVGKVAEKVFIPFSVGGGISTLDDIKDVILAGAEKVSVNSSAVKSPHIIEEGASLFGSQCIVVAMDVAADLNMASGYRVFVRGGRVSTELDALEWAKQVQSLGAGEIVLNSIDTDGVRTGYELNLTKMISETVGIPVVASGGAGTPQHLVDVFKKGSADAALIASMVHFDDYSIKEIKEYLSRNDIHVRL